ncbi:MAG: cytidylate kinase family protein [Dysgonamonadaceae bacterium]|nr:cytidylate kinase family protein [Dysgonamonadaceae bacterium]
MRIKNTKKITLSGNIGTGKSTVGKLLAEKSGYKFISVGNFSREFAQKEFGLTINEFQEKCKQQPELDDLIDQKFKQYCNEHDNIVADYRLGFHFIENSFNILLKVSENVSVQRVQSANRKTEFVDTGSIRQRNQEMKQRFIDKYHVDFTDESNYNLVIDTDESSPETIINTIINSYE